MPGRHPSGEVCYRVCYIFGVFKRRAWARNTRSLQRRSYFKPRWGMRSHRERVCVWRGEGLEQTPEKQCWWQCFSNVGHVLKYVQLSCEWLWLKAKMFINFMTYKFCWSCYQSWCRLGSIILELGSFHFSGRLPSVCWQRGASWLHDSCHDSKYHGQTGWCVYVLDAHSCPTLCDPMDCSPSGSSVHGDSPGKNTGVGCHFLLQGIIPTQGSNLELPHCM